MTHTRLHAHNTSLSLSLLECLRHKMNTLASLTNNPESSNPFFPLAPIFLTFWGNLVFVGDQNLRGQNQKKKEERRQESKKGRKRDVGGSFTAKKHPARSQIQIIASFDTHSSPPLSFTWAILHFCFFFSLLYLLSLSLYIYVCMYACMCRTMIKKSVDIVSSVPTTACWSTWRVLLFLLTIITENTTLPNLNSFFFSSWVLLLFL